MTQRPVKFGMEPIICKPQRGLQSPKVKIADGFKNQEHSVFAKEIRFEDILYAMPKGHGVKLSAKEHSVLKKMFKDIAGEDDVIDAAELKSYFEKLQKAAGKDGTLQAMEIYNLAHTRGEVNAEISQMFGMAKSFDTHLSEVPGLFVDALFNANKNKVAPQAKTADATAPKSKKQANNKNSYVINEKQIKDASGKVIKEITTFKDGDSITKIYGKKDGSYTEIIKYSDGKSKTETVENYHTKKAVEKDAKGKVTCEETYRYGADGILISRTEKRAEGKITQIEKYYKSGNTKENTYFNEDGTTEISYYKDNNSYNATKSVYKDKDGNVKSTTEFSYNKKGKLAKIVEKDKDGNIKSTEEYFYDKKGETAKIVKKDKDGNITKTSSQEGTKWVTRDADNNIIYTSTKTKTGYKQEYYNKGKLICSSEGSWRTIKSGDTHKDADGNIITKEQFKAILEQNKPKTERPSSD